MNLLVTGATGFIGRHLVDRLLADRPKDTLYCLVRSPIPAHEAEAVAALCRRGVRIIEGDLERPEVSRMPAPCASLVFHLAANPDTALPDTALRVNDVGTQHLIDWLGERARGARIVYTSSVAVLDRDAHPDGPLTETSPCHPRTGYGRTKLGGEQALVARADAAGYSYTVLRLGTVFGPGAKTGGLFDRLFSLTERHRLLGRLNWPGRTSVVHVDDVARLLSRVAAEPQAANQIYCVANPDAPTVGELAVHIGNVSGHPIEPVRLPEWLWRAARAVVWRPWLYRITPGRAFLVLWWCSLLVDNGFWMDTAKLQEVWSEPFTSLDDGLRDMDAGRRQPKS